MRADGGKAITLLLLATLSACSVTDRVVPEQYLSRYSPPEILVIDNTGVVYVLEQPSVVGEDLRGIDAHTTDTVVLPLARVQEAMVTRRSKVRTAVLVGSLVAVAGAAVMFERGGTGDSCKLISDHEDVVGKGTLCEEISEPVPREE